MSRQNLVALPFSEILASAPLVTLGDLPPEATFATVHYCIEADDMPANSDAIAVFRSVPARLIQVPVAVLRAFMMTIPEIADDFDSFDDYHAWYLENNKTPRYGSERRWPCISSKLPDEAVQDGSHRMHSYIRAGHATIPVLEYDSKAWWRAHAAWSKQRAESLARERPRQAALRKATSTRAPEVVEVRTAQKLDVAAKATITRARRRP